MFKVLESVLGRLRGSFFNKAEEKFEERDAAKADSHASTFAAGEAHAYGRAADEVKNAEEEEARDSSD